MNSVLIPVMVGLAITSGLLAGFFFAWWCSSMIGLRNVSDPVFVETMQEINRVLPNGRFAVPFFAPVILAPICAYLAFGSGEITTGWWCVGATILSAVTFVITAAANVPLNNALEEAGREDDSAARAAFEGPWTRWNNLRTATSILAFCSAVGAMVVSG